MIAKLLEDRYVELAAGAAARLYSMKRYQRVGIGDVDLPQQEVAIRGRAEPMTVSVVAEAKMLSALVGAIGTTTGSLINEIQNLPADTAV